jgi:putative ABC transport system permease protein
MLFKIAFRNILRNRRRSVMSIGAIAVSAVAMVLFGGFIAVIILGTQTDTVRRTGHLAIYRKGYFTYGSGNPAAWGIVAYKDVLAMIRSDKILAPMINVVTPTVSLSGIAGNFAADASRTFIATGVVPADRERMRRWNPYDIPYTTKPGESGLDDADPSKGVIGTGLARVLGLCAALGLADCPPVPPKAEEPPAGPINKDIAALAAAEKPAEAARRERHPHIDLLAATANGAPNVVSMAVTKADRQGIKELDDAMVIMHLDLAQQLLYGRGEPRAIAIVIQLHHTEDLAAARSRVAELIRQKGLDLEVRDFMEIVPFYGQVLGMFAAIFTFIAAIMGVIVLFTVVNTMGMSVMERTAEIGTARAIGLRRGGIRRQFLIEGWLLGAIGATAGIALGVVAALIVNASGLTWLPPGQSGVLPLAVKIRGMGMMYIGIWFGLMAMTTLAAIIPANRAARLPVVDALRHV